MLEVLKTARKVVGIKQSIRAVKEGRALVAYIASDADRHIIQQLEALCDETIKTVKVDTWKSWARHAVLRIACRCTKSSSTGVKWDRCI